jgi:hypothetical protein
LEDAVSLSGPDLEDEAALVESLEVIVQYFNLEYGVVTGVD